jgi:hypothetical protein
MLRLKSNRPNQSALRPPTLVVLLNSVIFSKSLVSVAVGLAVFAAAIRLPAAPCVLTNVASPKACQPNCCANKTCCKTSKERTEPPAQPLVKSSQDQQNVAAVPAAIPVALPVQIATEPRVAPRAKCSAHSPPPFALICIRLI